MLKDSFSIHLVGLSFWASSATYSAMAAMTYPTMAVATYSSMAPVAYLAMVLAFYIDVVPDSSSTIGYPNL